MFPTAIPGLPASLASQGTRLLLSTFPLHPTTSKEWHNLLSEPVRLDGSPNDAGSSSAGSPPPSSPSSPGGDNPDNSSPPPSTSISRQSIPENYPQVLALPIARRPLFPGFYKAVVIRNPHVVAAVKEMMKRGQPYLGAFLLKDEQADSDVITDISSVHPVGVFAQITSVEDEKEEGLTAVLYPHRRIKITDLLSTVQLEDVDSPPTDPELSVDHAKRHPDSFLQDYNVSIVNITNLLTRPTTRTTNTYVPSYIAQLNPSSAINYQFSINQVATNVFDEPDKLADFAAAVSTGEVGELQDVLESLVVEDRLRKALLVLKKELINAQLQSKLSRDVDSKIAKRQREYYLMEQLKGIKKELGMESDGKDKLIEKLKARAAQLAMPEPVKRVFDEELAKLTHLEPAASEANVTRNYLDWLTQIPWGQHSPENYSITNAKKTSRTAYWSFWLSGSYIICLVGPPGVGKTSIGKFSVGGLTDVAEIKGHRRTYVGALPGKIIQALKRVGTENPLVLIDEVDKVGRGINGDPASALLEMLDPEQNNAFLDHYMDVPVDLSRVLFVCTANILDTIPAPLLDRMEVIEVSGYVSEEKSMIAERYLGPQAKEASGLKDTDVYYCRESGVRNLKKHIDKIYRKASLKIVEDLGEDAFPETEAQPASTSTADNAVPAQDPLVDGPVAPETTTPHVSAETSNIEKKVTTEKRKPFKNLKDYVGPPVYHKDRMYVRPPPAGVSTGLGYLGNGSGAVMPIEATIMPGKGGLQLTGKLGEVIRESAQIALSWTKANAHALGVTKDASAMILNDLDVHVHMPEGSIGKEGPSAGTALLSAFVSLFTKTPISPDIAMTGEISLEKILAAHRAGIKTILAPAANRADIEENVPESVKTGIRFVYVEDVKEVLTEVFSGTPLVERLRDTLPTSFDPR
ncbi:Lon protease C-terminal proteolytic domain-containing protein [Russula vinacea]|nr:Lon protease C-terminal proteolytic domain-containing protein [Russula vinacea]